MPDLFAGGSFDPVHYGHLRCAQAVADESRLDRIVLIPAAVSPHKMAASKPAPPLDRLEMCRLAAADAGDRFSVDDLELRRPPPSFTIDTVRELKRRGHAQVHWMIGGDQVPTLPYWHEAHALLREARLLIVARPGFDFDFDALPPEFRHLHKNIVFAPRIDISASDIRQRVRDGRSIDGLTPASVVRYILQRSLYLQPRQAPPTP